MEPTTPPSNPFVKIIEYLSTPFFVSGLALYIKLWLDRKKDKVEEKTTVAATQETLIQDMGTQIKEGWKVIKNLQERCDRQTEQMALYQLELAETKAQLVDVEATYKLLLERSDPEKMCNRTDCPRRLRD